MGQDKQPDSPWVLPVLKFSPARALPVPRVAADGFCHMSQCWGRVPAPQQGWVGCVAAPGLHPGWAEPLARRAWLCAVPGSVQSLPVPSPWCHCSPPARWHRTPRDSTRILLLLSPGIPWNAQAHSCLSFVLQKEKQPLSQQQEGKVEMNPGLQDPRLGQSPGEVLAPSPCSSFQTTGNRRRIRLKSGNFLCCSVLTPLVNAG